MKVSREQAAENREKILKLAATIYREKGFDGIGIADLMKAAGLTHGGFYGHFSSKEELMAQACTRAVDDLLAQGYARRTEREGDPFEIFVEYYLSRKHRDNSGSGCLMAALGCDAARQSPKVRSVFTENAKRMMNSMKGLLKGRVDEARVHQQALITLSTLVGAQVIARAIDDEQLSQEVLAAVADSVLH